MTHVLRIDTSPRGDTSITRDLAARITGRIGATGVTIRNLADPLPHVTAEWIAANTTAPAERDAAQRDRLTLSDTLIAEIEAADVLVIGVPVYNFTIPAALKSWIDLVCRAGVTFRYSEDGPVGLLEGKRAVLAMASGGTKADSDIDFALPYMRHVLGFIGINDVQVVAADALALDADATIAAAHAEIGDLRAAA